MVSWLLITTLDHCLRDNNQPRFGCQNVDTRPENEAEPPSPDLFLRLLFTVNSTFKGQREADVSQKPARLTARAVGCKHNTDS